MDLFHQDESNVLCVHSVVHVQLDHCSISSISNVRILSIQHNNVSSSDDFLHGDEKFDHGLTPECYASVTFLICLERIDLLTMCSPLTLSSETCAAFFSLSSNSHHACTSSTLSIASSVTSIDPHQGHIMLPPFGDQAAMRPALPYVQDVLLSPLTPVSVPLLLVLSLASCHERFVHMFLEPFLVHQLSLPVPL